MTRERMAAEPYELEFERASTALVIIDRQLNRAAVTAFIGAGLAWIGLIHGAQLGWGAAPMVALGYALFGVVCLIMAWQASPEEQAKE